eukprot:g7623.t1
MASWGRVASAGDDRFPTWYVLLVYAPGYFNAALTEWENRHKEVKCVECHVKGLKGTGNSIWRKVGEREGRSLYNGDKCRQRKRRSLEWGVIWASSVGGSQGPGGASKVPRRDPHATVREDLGGVLDLGEIVHWEDVARRLVEERKKANYRELKYRSTRKVVRGKFDAIANAPGSRARVIEGSGEANEGMEACATLFPVRSSFNDDVLVGYFLRARQSEENSAPLSPPASAGTEAPPSEAAPHGAETSDYGTAMGGKYIASQDIKGTHWVKSKGDPRDVIDFCAKMGLWATTSQLQQRGFEDLFVKHVDVKDRIVENAESTAIPVDNCDKDITVSEIAGEGRHCATITATITTRGPEVGKLEDASKLRPRRDLTLTDVTNGQEWEAEAGNRRFEAFEEVLFTSVLESVSSSSGRDNQLTRLGAVLRRQY